MITTGCEGCCFLKRDNKGKGCMIGQACKLKDNKIFAPGYCRYCRSNQWAQNETNIKKLLEKVIAENELKFDLLIFFDEAVNRIEDLEQTLDSDWYQQYVQKIIIMDTTGCGNRQNLALQYIRKRVNTISIVVDSSIAHESHHQSEDTISRVSKQVIAPFFLVMPAGLILQKANLDLLAKTIQHVPSRVIHWLFSFTIYNTMVIPNLLNYGLFLTKPYKTLMRHSTTKSFTQQLKQEELEIEMGLSWFCSGCQMVSDCVIKY